MAVNHLKSKGSLSGLPEDEAQGDGQGNNNATRAEAASILADWLASDPTGQGAANQLILGDLNSYAREDPINVLRAAGFTDIAGERLGEDALSFVFDGQGGALDFALANEALFAKLAGVTEWHVNADEADAIDYNLDFGRDPTLFDGGTAARNSDHDPVIVSFDFEAGGAPDIIGTPEDDRLIGTAAGERIDGLGGRDVIFGNGGGDTIVLGDGDKDQFRGFDTGLDRLDVTAWGVQSFEELTITDRGALVTIQDMVSRNLSFTRRDDDLSATEFTADNFIFAPVADLTVTGGDGFDRLSGRAGDDVIDGGAGFNRLTGLGGEDTFVIGTTRGDYVLDFTDGEDVLDLSAWDAAGFDDLTIRDQGGVVTIREAGGSNLARLDKAATGIAAADLEAVSFVFGDPLLA